MNNLRVKTGCGYDNEARFGFQSRLSLKTEKRKTIDDTSATKASAKLKYGHRNR
jgi:hypothetical protein